jgi:predicted PurR-regulated permease PerM
MRRRCVIPNRNAEITMTRSHVSLAVLGLVAVGTLILAPTAFFVIFAGALLAVGLAAGGDWLSDRTGLGRGWGVGLFLFGILLALVLITLLFVPAIARQLDELAQSLPAAFEALRARVQTIGWLDDLLSRADPLAGPPEGAGSAAAAAVTTTFGSLANLVIVLIIGIYGAISPGPYRRGLRALLAPSLRPRGDEVMDRCTRTLRRWLGAQLLSMTVVGVLTGLGLWLVGVPLAFLLGLIAGIFAFIPNIGPILAAIPALLLASTSGGTAVLLTLGVFLVVQSLETYLITPMIQQDQVSLPPALLIAMQLLFGVLFGLGGLMLASPLTALGMTLVNQTYRRDYLEREPAPPRRSIA